jgi:hypothetical protein
MTRCTTAWLVRVEAHDLHAGRWSIAEQVLEVQAINAIQARGHATRQLHVAAGVAPWRPLLRTTYVRTSATALGAPVGGGH